MKYTTAAIVVKILGAPGVPNGLDLDVTSANGRKWSKFDYRYDFRVDPTGRKWGKVWVKRTGRLVEYTFEDPA